MTKRSEHEWLGDIIAWGERLQRHIAGVDRAGFLGSEVIQDAVCKCVEAVGEAAGKLDDLDPELDRTVPGAEPQARPEDARSHDPRVLGSLRRPTHLNAVPPQRPRQTENGW
jgi:hypothetical protein